MLKKIKTSFFINVYLKQFYRKHFVSDERIIKREFKKRLGRDVDLKNPIKFNDKLQWLKLYWYDPLATKCADKYSVRNYVSKKVGNKFLNDVIMVYESVDEINIDMLPTSFVLKATHGSGFNIICPDKNQINWRKSFRKMKKWMHTNYYWSKREWVYRDIKPRIICEKYLESKEQDDFLDYRVFCFQGSPYIIMVDFDINNKSIARRNIYDLEWNLLNEKVHYERELSREIAKPKHLEKMLEISKKLSEDFPHVRIDFYIVGGNLYFSEMTFFHQSGMGYFYSEDFEIELGNQIKLRL